MSPLDAAWHFFNLFAPAVVVAALMALAIKALWRREARRLAWARLAVWGAAGGCLATVAALAVMGHDGTMAGYGLMLLGISLAQWLMMLKKH